MELTRISLMITDELKEKIERVAENEHRSFSGQVRLFLESAINTIEMNGDKSGE